MPMYDLNLLLQIKLLFITFSIPGMILLLIEKPDVTANLK